MFVSWKDIKAFVANLQKICSVATENEAHTHLMEFKKIWGVKYPSRIKNRDDNWDILNAFFTYPHEVRRIIYTTNAVESLHRQFLKVTNTKGISPTTRA